VTKDSLSAGPSPSGHAQEEGHLALIVEDDPETAGYLADILRARGDRPIVARTVAEALAILSKVDPCYVLADNELPAEEGAPPHTAAGERLLEAARTQDLRLVDGRFFVRQILSVTGVASDPDFVTRMHALGATHFQTKPLGRDGARALLDKIRVCLERAKRVSHDACALVARRPASAPPAPIVGPRIRIDGTRERTRMILFVEGERRTIQEGAMVPLLRAIVLRERSPGAWSAREALYMSKSNNATTRINQPFRGLVPDGFLVLESDGGGSFRLNPAVVVEQIDWAALAESANAQIRKLAKEQRERRAG
jgi:CheY-like chemotaxis protein